MTIKTTGAQQGWIQHIRAIGSCQHDYCFTSSKAIQFGEDLVQGLFAFIITTPQTGTSGTANTVQFVNKDNTGCTFLRGAKQLTYPGVTLADKDLDKLGT